MSIVQEFLYRTKMVDKNGTKKGVERMVEYLASPEIVNRMIIASELGLPALTLIARDLESKFDENSTFPVVVFENDANATARHNVGRIIKFVLGKYGYVPVSDKLEERTRIPAIANAKYFSTCAVYAKDESIVAELTIVVDSVLM